MIPDWVAFTRPGIHTAGQRGGRAGRGLVRKKRRVIFRFQTRPIFVFRPAPWFRGNGGSKSSGRAAGWDFPGVKWREGTGTLWRPRACCTENRVAGVHIVAGLGCEGPSVGYRQLARPCGPRSGGDYGVRLGEETRAGCGSINHGDFLQAGDVGEGGGLEGDGKGDGYRPCKCR
jgi:hypothetical protein